MTRDDLLLAFVGLVTLAFLAALAHDASLMLAPLSH